MGFECEEIRPRPAGQAPAPTNALAGLRAAGRAAPPSSVRLVGRSTFCTSLFSRFSTLSLTALSAFMVVALAPDMARADCVPDSATATTGDDVVCSGATPGGFLAGPAVDDLQILIQPGATVLNPSDGAAAIEVNANNPRGIDVQGDIEVNGDGSAGVRGGAGNFVQGIGTIADADPDPLAPVGIDTVGIDLGNDSVVRFGGDINLMGDGNIGIRVGDINADQDTPAFIEFDGHMRIDGQDARGVEIGNADPAVTLPGIDISGRVITAGPDSRAVVAGDGWRAPDGGILIGSGGFVQAAGDGAIAIDVGNDARVAIDGQVLGGAGDAPGLAAVRTGTQTDPDAVVIVTGQVTAAGTDALGISTGTRTLLVGESLFDDPLAPSVQIGTASDPGRVDGSEVAGALIDLRTGPGADDYGYVLINPSSAVVANENRFFEPNRAIAIQGTDGAERVDNYGGIIGKVRLEGGDDLFVLGTTGLIGGNQYVDGGDGRDRLELSNRARVFVNRPEAVFSFSQFWNFETLVVDDRVPWRATGTAAANSFENVFITPGSSLTVENPIDFTAGADTFVNEGAFDGEATLGAGADVYQQFQADGLTAQSRVDGGAGLDELDLQDSGTDTFGTLDLDTQVTGFERVILRTGSEWALGGDLTASGPGSSLAVEGDAQLRISRPLLLDGAVDFDADSTLRVQLNPAVSTAYLETTGAITIDEATPGVPSAALVIEPTGLLDSGSILLLTGGSLNGEFAFDPASNGAYQFSDRYDVATGSLFLDIVRNPLAPNRQATQDYLDAIESAGPDPELQAFLAELDSLPSDEYIESLDQLHPEPYDAQTSVQLALARAFQSAMLERPDHCIAPEGSGFRHPRTQVPCRPRPHDVWATGYGLIGSRDGEVGHITWDEHGGGVVLGADQRVGDTLLFSTTVGGAHVNQTVDGIGQGKFSALDVGALAAWNRGPLQVQGFATYGHGWHDAQRQIVFASVARTAEGQYQSNRYGVGGELSWTFAFSGLDVKPLFEVDWARVSRDGFTETGASPINLIVHGAADSVTNLLVGVELGTSWLKKGYWTDFLEKTDGVWEPQLAVGWRQVVQGADRALVSSYQGAPSASGRFQVDGQDANQGFEVGVGLYFTPKGATRISLGARYDAFVWKDVLLQDISGNVRFSF